jgi:hypothetical protein
VAGKMGYDALHKANREDVRGSGPLYYDADAAEGEHAAVWKGAEPTKAGCGEQQATEKDPSLGRIVELWRQIIVWGGRCCRGVCRVNVHWNILHHQRLLVTWRWITPSCSVCVHFLCCFWVSSKHYVKKISILDFLYHGPPHQDGCHGTYYRFAQLVDFVLKEERSSDQVDGYFVGNMIQ